MDSSGQVMARTDQPSGDDSRYCGGKKRQGDGYCTRPAGWGTDHPGVGRCKLHGGSTVSHAKQAKRVIAEREAKALNIQPREIGYQDALLEELWRTAGWISYLEQRVQSEGDDGLTQWGMTGRMASAWWSMLEDQRKHYVAVSVACGKAGIEERRVALAEQQGKLLAQVISQIVTGLGHNLHDEAVQSVVRPALQLVRSAA